MKKSLVIALLSMMAWEVHAGVAVIAHPSVADGATDKDIKKVFLGKKTDLGGVAVTPVDQKEGLPVRKAFYEVFIGQAEDEVKAHRTEMVFTGKGTPPREVGDDAAVKALVASTPGAIGYIDEGKVDASVKVLIKK
jgi:ABC-type phosphate transport system substrate-binding protein